MATPVFVGAKVVDLAIANISSVTISPASPTFGGDIAVGDLVLLTFNGGNVTPPLILPDWEEVYRADYSATRNAAIWYKIRTSSDADYTFSATSSNGGQATLSWFRGVDATLSDLAVGAPQTRSATSAANAGPSVAALVAESLIVTVSMEATTASEGAPTVSQGAQAFFAPQTTTPQIHTTYVSTLAQATPGESGVSTVTYANASGNGLIVQLAIPPSTGAVTPPSANFRSQRTGLVASFTDMSSDLDGVVTSHAWSFGDGATSIEANPVQTFDASGDYEVSLTVTDDSDATDTKTLPYLIPNPIESNTRGATLYDSFSRYSDGTDPSHYSALTGQQWHLYSGPAEVNSGTFDSVPGTGASYLYAEADHEITRLGARFRFDTNDGALTGNGGTVAIMVWDNVQVVSTRTTRCHFVLSELGMSVGVVTAANGPIVDVASAGFTTTKDVDHVLEVELSGNTVTAYVDGVQRLTATDSRLGDRAGQRQAVFEPYYNNEAVDARAQFYEVWANWGAPSTQPWSAVYVGDQPASAVYVGAEQVWP